MGGGAGRHAVGSGANRPGGVSTPVENVVPAEGFGSLDVI